MLFPIKQLIEEHAKLLCVKRDAKVSDALALMMQNDYSQLPVIDENGKLCGIVTEKSINSTYFHTHGVVSLLNLNVDNCLTPPVTISPDRDLFDALDLLKNVYAIVVEQENKPIGIVTNYDTTNFFQNITGGLLLIEDIEVSLRLYIENILPIENDLLTALIFSFGSNKHDPGEPAKKFNELTLGEYIRLIMTEENWPKFEAYLKPKELFFEFFNQVREIRNQLAHFRGRLDPLQLDALNRTREWLSNRPKVAVSIEVKSSKQIQVSDNAVLTFPKWNKNTPLSNLFTKNMNKKKFININIDDFEKYLGEELPQSARNHASWWDNDYFSNQYACAWLLAGWRVKDVDLNIGEITFQYSKQILYQLFFADLLERLKSMRPSATTAKKTYPQNWWWFGAGKSGYSFGWEFTGHGTLRTELYIDLGDKTINKSVFDKLFAQKVEIEKEFGAILNWERLDKARASRISIEMTVEITDPHEQLENAKIWALDMIFKFIDVFQPKIIGL